jgi:hypothetical protein
MTRIVPDMENIISLTSVRAFLFHQLLSLNDFKDSRRQNVSWRL